MSTFFFKYLSIFFYSDFERDYFSESNDMPHVRMHLTVTAKIIVVYLTSFCVNWAFFWHAWAILKRE
jgi:hypothetical protein